MSRRCMVSSDEEDEDGNLAQIADKKVAKTNKPSVGEVIYLSEDTSRFQPEEEEITDKPIPVTYVSTNSDGEDSGSRSNIGNSYRKPRGGIVTRSGRSVKTRFPTQQDDTDEDPLGETILKSSGIVKRESQINTDTMTSIVVKEEPKLLSNVSTRVEPKSVENNQNTPQAQTTESKETSPSQGVKRNVPSGGDHPTAKKVKYDRQATPICDAIMKEYSRRQKLLKTQGGSGTPDLSDLPIHEILAKAKKGGSSELQKVSNSSNNETENTVEKPATVVSENIRPANLVNQKINNEEVQLKDPLAVQVKQELVDMKPNIADINEPVSKDNLMPSNYIDVKPPVTETNTGEANKTATNDFSFVDIHHVDVKPVIVESNITNQLAKRGKPYVAMHRIDRTSANSNKPATTGTARRGRVRGKARRMDIDYDYDDDDDEDKDPAYVPGKDTETCRNTRSSRKVTLPIQLPSRGQGRRGRPRAIRINETSTIATNENSESNSGLDEHSVQIKQEVILEEYVTDSFELPNISNSKVLYNQLDKSHEEITQLGSAVVESVKRTHTSKSLETEPMTTPNKCAFIMDYVKSFQEVFDTEIFHDTIPVLAQILMLWMDDLDDWLQRKKNTQNMTSDELRQETQFASKTFLKTVTAFSEKFFPQFDIVANNIRRTKTAKAVMVTFFYFITGSLFMKSPKYKGQIHKVRAVLILVSEIHKYNHPIVWQVLQEDDETYETELKMLICILNHFHNRKYLLIPNAKLLTNWFEDTTNVQFQLNDKSNIITLKRELSILFPTKMSHLTKVNCQSNKQITSLSHNNSKVSNFASQLIETLNAERDGNSKRIEEKLDNILSFLTGSKLEFQEIHNKNSVGPRRRNIMGPNIKADISDSTKQADGASPDSTSEERGTVLAELFNQQHGAPDSFNQHLDSLFHSYLNSTTQSKVQVNPESVDVSAESIMNDYMPKNNTDNHSVMIKQEPEEIYSISAEQQFAISNQISSQSHFQSNEMVDDFVEEPGPFIKKEKDYFDYDN